jgi:choline dehydrogenase-like flavoprotein
VYGVRALRIADASVIPGLVGANPNATVPAIGKRCASMLLE